MSRERRGFARLYVGVEAIYRQKVINGTENKVLVQDISVSGVRFISSEHLANNTLLEFSLTIPDIPLPVTALGKVMWQKRFSESFYDTGIEFTEINPQLRETLSKYIKSALGRVEEHREFVRANLSTMIAYRCLNNLDEEKRCISVDISPSGLKVFMKEGLETGTCLALCFTLPDEPQAIKAEGKIIWVRAREEQFSEAGIEFTQLNDEFSESINAYVKKTLGIDW
jgi:c-di-GMP-binding flagellar brake protein YcgR